MRLDSFLIAYELHTLPASRNGHLAPNPTAGTLRKEWQFSAHTVRRLKPKALFQALQHDLPFWGN